MTLEERKDNTYYDQTGKQILVGDLLRVFHYQTKRRIHHMYHVVVMEGGEFPVMAARSCLNDKPHYRLYAVANKQRVLEAAKIVDEKDWETKRKKIRVNQTPRPSSGVKSYGYYRTRTKTARMEP